MTTPYQGDEGEREGERGRAKQGAQRKTQFILNNWLHLSKHCRAFTAVFSNQFYTNSGEKISPPGFSFIALKEPRKKKKTPKK